MPRRRNRWLGCLILALLGVGCGEEPAPFVPDPAIEPFVGTWDAEVFTVTSDADPALVADLLENGSFFIVIQPSGSYTGVLQYGALSPVVEDGQLSVSGGFVTLTPDEPNPCPASSEYTFTSEGYLVLEGPTCFDFNLDGELDDAYAQLELRRR